MAFDLIISQGRIADRTPGAITGAAEAARAIENLYGLQGRRFGSAAPAVTDDWRASLPGARETLVELGKAVAFSIDNSRTPVMVANTCSASLASLPVVAQKHPNAIVLWFDAHGDFNTPATTKSGYLGGMVLAAACGLWDSGHGGGLRPEQVILIGGQDVDPLESELLRDAGVRIISPDEAAPESILALVGQAPVWIHVDWDSLEPGYVPAAYRVAGGLLPGQVKAIFAALLPERVVGMELAEFEASSNATENAKAISIILETISPLLS